MASVKDFSVEEKLVNLYKLQTVDSSIDQIEILRGELPMEVKDLEDEIEGFNTRIAAIDSEIKIINDDILAKKALQADSVALLKKYEKQQNNVKNSREFEAINKEMELQDLEIKACEKKIKDAIIEISDQEVFKGNTQKQINEKQEVLKLKKTELKKITEETEKDEKDLLLTRKKAEDNVDTRLLLAYSRIRSNYRNGLAVVPVERDSCGGCYNVIPPQRQSDIRLRKKMIVCEHCGRIMIDSELNDSVKI